MFLMTLFHTVLTFTGHLLTQNQRHSFCEDPIVCSYTVSVLARPRQQIQKFYLEKTSMQNRHLVALTTRDLQRVNNIYRIS